MSMTTWNALLPSCTRACVCVWLWVCSMFDLSLYKPGDIMDAAEKKTNPLKLFAGLSANALNFVVKFYRFVYYSCLHLTAKLQSTYSECDELNVAISCWCRWCGRVWMLDNTAHQPGQTAGVYRSAIKSRLACPHPPARLWYDIRKTRN